MNNLEKKLNSACEHFNKKNDKHQVYFYHSSLYDNCLSDANDYTVIVVPLIKTGSLATGNFKMKLGNPESSIRGDVKFLVKELKEGGYND